MVKKVALVAIDRVIADGSARFERADMEKQNYLSSIRDVTGGNTGENAEKNAVNLYWKAALNGDELYTDTLIPGADKDLAQLAEEGWEVVYFTSRPESMREGTITWLERYEILSQEQSVFMKPEEERYTKTYKWKAKKGLEIAREYQADELLVIDDDKANTDEIQSFHTPGLDIFVYSSLQEALAGLASEHGGERATEESGPSTIDMLLNLLEVETNELEPGQRIYTSSASYDISRYHIIEKTYDGIQIDQTETNEKWGKRVNFHTNEIPGLLKTLLNWYLEGELQKIADLANEDEHPF